MPLESKPGLISMLAGKPNSSTFPFTSIQLTARSPTDPTKGRDLDHRSEGAGNRSPVWADLRNTQPFGVDLGPTGIRAWEKARRRVEAERWGWVSGRYIQGMRYVMQVFHLADCIRRLSTRF
jgi:hypothetical protein